MFWVVSTTRALSIKKNSATPWMMLTSVSSICNTIESNSERAAENFIVDLAWANSDSRDTAPKFRATSASPSRAIADREWRLFDSGFAVKTKARFAISLRVRIFSDSKAAHRQNGLLPSQSHRIVTRLIRLVNDN